MANIQHKDITDPNIHEPKGVQFAEKGTAYVADGNGSGSWQQVIKPGSAASVFTELIEFSGSAYIPRKGSASITPSYVHKAGAEYFDVSSGKLIAKESGAYFIDYFYKISINETEGLGSDWPASGCCELRTSSSIDKKQVQISVVSGGKASASSLYFASLKKGDSIYFYTLGEGSKYQDGTMSLNGTFRFLKVR